MVDLLFGLLVPALRRLLILWYSPFFIAYDLTDLSPRHPHLALDRRLGEFGSLRQSPLILLLRAQYASARLLPIGPILLPFAPYLTVLVRPVFGFVTVLLNFFFILFWWLVSSLL